VWLWTLAGRLDFSVGGILPADTPDTTVLALFLLFLFGTGKAALMPIHRWLPQAMVAPTPVSALLHAVAVVKAGAFVILKVSAMVIGSERLGGTLASSLGVLLACFTIVAASLVALGRDNLKERLAYSTVAQLAYIVLGAALAVPSGLFGGAMHVAMHAFAKITLFFCAGAIVFAAGATRVSELDGMGRRQPLIMAAFLIGSLGIIGLPPGGGTWSKWLLMQATLEGGYWVATVALALSSLLSIYYLLTIPLRAFLLAPAPGARTADGAVPAGCRITIAATALGTVALFFLPGPLHALLAG